tara:strand:+ start:594 stop:1586 length:993 start_codon:yes stop_codon:yes gene_type:complete
MQNKIFVYFACFHDNEVIPTIKDAYKTATLPQNVVFGIDFQFMDKQIKDDFVDWVERNPQYNIRYKLTEYKVGNFWELIGLAKGRKRAYELREDEPFALLIDGHSKFGWHWDTKLIHRYIKAESITEKPILHGYAGYYVLGPNQERLWHRDEYMRQIRYQYYVNYREDDPDQMRAKFKWHDRLPTFVITRENPDTDDLIPNVKFSGNFSFTRYDICKHLPDWVLFEDEEIPWSINLFDAGYSFVFPSFKEPILAHLYMGTAEPYPARESRDNIEFYLDDLESFLRTKDENINKFLDDPANKSKIEKYEKYARVKILNGTTEEYYVPKTFR